MRVEIKNTKIFTVDKNCKYHWSKLPKFIKFMKENFLTFKFGAYLSGVYLSGADKNTPEKLTIKDFMLVQGLGSANRVTYFYDTEEIGLVIQCGCFYGTEKAFKKAVKETHKDGQYAKEYLSMLKVVKIRFSRGNNADNK